MHDPDGTIPRARLDALADAVYGVAMTLLVIAIALPDNFKPHSAEEFGRALYELRPQFLVYVITFFVVGLRWFGMTQLGGKDEQVSFDYAKWMLVNLFLITCLPFSTMIVGRYGNFPISPAIYGLNTILSALASLRLSYMARHHANIAATLRFNIGLVILILSAALSIAVGALAPHYAMAPYFLNAATPYLARLLPKQKRSAAR
jgi:uncharacterized membrane protein